MVEHGALFLTENGLIPHVVETIKTFQGKRTGKAPCGQLWRPWSNSGGFLFASAEDAQREDIGCRRCLAETSGRAYKHKPGALGHG
jgi:hypothetical protein